MDRDRFSSTLRDAVTQADPAREPEPGLLLVHALGRPQCVVLPLENGELEIGRGDTTSRLPADPKMSRRHARVEFNGAQFRVCDLGSQNGSHVDGVRGSARLPSGAAQVLRTGDCVFLCVADLHALRTRGVVVDGELVIGPTLRRVLDQAGRAAQFGTTLHVTGETGSGKEGVARAFHRASERHAGPFVAINCATIAPGVAERLLFGARRGAYSGAVADTEGLVQSADGGTLFLDEIGELDPAVQAKLLRVLETREVLPMGAVRPRQISMQLCSASLRDLRAEVAQGRFREDLYFRLSRPEAVVPPLRQRREEIPWLIERALHDTAPGLWAHSTFVETCLLRAWPGNVRELLAETRAAAQDALGQGVHSVETRHLNPRAGIALVRAAEPQVSAAPPPSSSPVQKASPRPMPERAQVEAALGQSGGNISATARLLGLHRTQLKRLLDKFGLGAGRGDAGGDGDADE